MATITFEAPAAAAGHPLRDHRFRLLWIGRTVSNLGDQYYLVALPWLVLQLTNSSLVLGTIMMTATIPLAAFTLVGGAVSDRLSPRLVWMASTSVRSASVAFAGVLIWFHIIQIWHIYVLAFVFGVADAFAGPAAQAYVPSLVTRDQLPAAISVNQVTQQLTAIVGPAPAGFMIKALGVAWAFFADAISFLFIIGALWSLPDPPPPARSTGKSLLHSIGEGLTYINSDPAMRSMLIFASALNFCLSGTFSVGLAWIARHNFASPVAFSVFVSSAALGSLLGLAIAGIYRPRSRGRAMLIIGALLALCTGVLGLVTQVSVVSAVLLAMGAAAGFLNVHIFAWFQQRVEREMLGRATSVLMFAAVGLTPLSVLIAGIAVQWSVVAMFGGAGALMLSATAIASATKRLREIA